MRSPHCCPLVVSLLLGTVALFPGRPAAAADGASGPDAAAGASVLVARLNDDAAVVARQYEKLRHESETQRSIASRDEKLLVRARTVTTALHKDLGRIARAQYRQSGGVSYTSLLPDSTRELMQTHDVLARVDLAVAYAVARSRQAETRLTRERTRASARWRALQKQYGVLATRNRTVQTKLDVARAVLQRQADAAAATRTCRGAVHLQQPRRRIGHPWVTPVEGYRLSAGFGSGGSHWARGHTGQDFAVPIGSPVRAVGAGQVVRVTCGGAFGMEVVIKHAGGFCTQYAHLAAVTVDQGDRVKAGQWIAQSGTTGNSTGPHLHFEVRSTPAFGSGVNPVPWLAARGVKV
ncbi:M23 family metallopeptidase [Streptomyces sp. NPDC003631]